MAKKTRKQKSSKKNLVKKRILLNEPSAKSYAYSILKSWEKNPNKELTLIASLKNNRSKDLFSKIVEKYAVLKKYINNSNIVIFESDKGFFSDVIKAWNGYNNGMFKSYNNTLRNFKYFEDSFSLKAIPVRRRKIRTKNFDLWNLEMIGAFNAKKYSSGSNVKVGVIDTGIDFDHKEFEGKKSLGYNFIDDSLDFYDDNGHGTHVAGIIGGKNVGISNAILYSLKVLDSYGSGDLSDIITSVDWAISKNLDVLNLSLGSPSYSFGLEEIINVAHNKGIYVVAAAGNEGKGYSFPAAYENVISVTAIDKNKRHAEFSNVNDMNDISAPGVNVLSSYRMGYSKLSGTSMASPHVAGSLALMLDYSRREDYDELMKNNAEKIPYRGKNYEHVFGAGLLRVDSVIENTPKNDYKRILKKAIEVLW